MSAEQGVSQQQQRWLDFGAALSHWLVKSKKTQTDVARALKVSTSTVSTWKLGQGEPEKHWVTFELERLVGAPAGALSQYLGYLPTDAVAVASSWEEALGVDPSQVDDLMRDALLALIRAMKKEG